MKITISYQPQQLPPPFAYAAVLSTDISESDVNATLQLEYLDRESVSDDELRAEGFTRDDDFSWTGKLNHRWKSDFEILASAKTKNDPDADIYIHLEVDGKTLGFPQDIISADIFFQEILQAILEEAEIEQPLELVCNMNGDEYHLFWKFSQRIIERNQVLSEEWETGRSIIKLIYSIDFDSVKKSKKPQDNSVNIGDDNWYHLPKKVVAELSDLLQRL